MASSKKTARPRASAGKAATKRAPTKAVAPRRASVDRAAPQRASAAALVIPDAMKPIVDAFAGVKAVSVEKGWGSNSVALKTRGKIFAMLVRGDLVLKLPGLTVDGIVAAHGARRFDPRGDGRVMKEWLVVPPNLRDRVKLAREAFEFVAAGT